MIPSQARLLRCPATGGEFTLSAREETGGPIKTGVLRNADGAEYPIIDCIPRFVHADNYASSLGFQWNPHSRTRHETDTVIAASERRLFEETKWTELLPGGADELFREWSYLDTFDWFSPAYDLPQTVAEFARWHREGGLEAIEVHRGWNGVEGRGRKPA